MVTDDVTTRHPRRPPRATRTTSASTTTFDFLNTHDTEDGFPVETLPTLDDALAWFADRGVIHVEGADRARREAADGPTPPARDIERVHTVRGALREVADAVVEHRVPRGQRARPRSIARSMPARSSSSSPPRTAVHVDHRHVGDPVDDALARLSDALVRELTAGEPERIRVCASDTCNWVFYDASRTARRRWCDMATLRQPREGRRATAPARRERRRARAGGPDGRDRLTARRRRSALERPADAGSRQEQPLEDQEQHDREDARDRERGDEHPEVRRRREDRQPHGQRLEVAARAGPAAATGSPSRSRSPRTPTRPR